MKHIKPFNGFVSESQDVNPSDDGFERYLQIFYRILGFSGDNWFTNGEDAPSEITEELEEEKVNDEELQELIEFTAGGPGFTDVWLENNELISDAVEEGHSEEEIYDDNQRYFSEKRLELINKIVNKIVIDNVLFQKFLEIIRKEGNPKIINVLKSEFPNLWEKIKPLLGNGSNEIEDLADSGF
jgi:hypothetical protein